MKRTHGAAATSFHGAMAHRLTLPHVMGHEVVGTIHRVGPAVTTLRPGQRVVLNPWLSCAPRGITPICEVASDSGVVR